LGVTPTEQDRPVASRTACLSHARRWRGRHRPARRDLGEVDVDLVDARSSILGAISRTAALNSRE
jgi:hypothetical protein